MQIKKEIKEIEASKYLVYSIKAGELINYQLLMLRYQRIEGIMPFTIHKEGELTFLYYPIDSYRPRNYQAKEGGLAYIEVKERQVFLRGIKIVAESLRDYLLYSDNLYLDRDSCFYNEKSGKWKFTYLPVRDKEICIRKNMEFFKEISSENLDARRRLAMLEESGKPDIFKCLRVLDIA